VKSSTFLTRALPLLGSEESVAIKLGTDRFRSLRTTAVAAYPPMEQMRARAAEIRRHAVANLGHYVAQFVENLQAVGGVAHVAANAQEACEIVEGLIDPDSLIVKSKSMLTEEIALNEALERRGHRVVETDLGEFILQLAGGTPSHIIAPVMHMNRAQIGGLFAERLQAPYTDDPTVLNNIARRYLREIFLSADVGISGANFGVAATGSIVTVTNEGNGRFITTAPRVHIAVLGIERLVPSFSELAVMLEVLARSATGQPLSVYTNVVTGPRRPGEPDGPEELHVVLVDNGRSLLVGGEFEEALSCIRCGACLNVCPVYREVGGHGYGSVYSGPIGAVLSPLLFGEGAFGELAYASTLCGACLEVCPVGIDLPRMLVAQRRREAVAGRAPNPAASLARRYSGLSLRPSRFGWMWRLARLATWPLARRGFIRGLPGPGRAWTDHHVLRRPARRSFRRIQGTDSEA
jgi:L-lactate dehydrogenase complex protein LldF